MAGAAAVGYTGPDTVIVPATAETRNLMKDSSHAQRLEEWFALYAESLPQDAGVAKLPKGQLPWSDTIVEKTPVLRSLMGWALRYGFKRDQLKRKLQDWKPGVKIKLNDHTTAIASKRRRLGDLDQLGRIAVAAARCSDTSILCAPGSLGGSHFAHFLKTHDETASRYCTMHIERLLTLSDTHRVSKARSKTASSENAFAAARITADCAATRAQRDATAVCPPPPVDVATSTESPNVPPPPPSEPVVSLQNAQAAAVSTAVQKHMHRALATAKLLVERGETDVAEVVTVLTEVVPTAATAVLSELHSAAFRAFAKGLSGEPWAMDVDSSAAAGSEEGEADVVYYIAGWLVFIVWRMGNKLNAEDPRHIAAMDFRKRATIEPAAALRDVRLPTKKAEQRFEIAGYEAIFASKRMLAFTYFLEGVFQRTLGTAKQLRLHGPTAMQKLSVALRVSEVTKSKLKDVLRGADANEVVRFGVGTVPDDALSAFANDSAETQARVFGEVLPTEGYVEVVLDVICASFVRMRGKDLVKSLMNSLSTKELAVNTVAHRGVVGVSAGSGTSKTVRVRDDVRHDPLNEEMDFLHPSSNNGKVAHRADCDCAGSISSRVFCRLKAPWECDGCGVKGFRTYYAAAACECGTSHPPLPESRKRALSD
eukprot:m.23018 g.23018  ORF g.23018 m.23018 type:complete len:653 (+) comp10880_c0_seq1:62-2020(+)